MPPPPGALNPLRPLSKSLQTLRRGFPSSSISPLSSPCRFSPATNASATITTKTTRITAAASRAFSTTQPAQVKTIKPHRLPSNLIPPYPYGERRVYKQSNRGLYGTARIRFGNIIAERYRNKARRFWRPNVHVKVFYSASLDARIKTRLTLRVLKTIRREGGIDNYLLKSKPARLKELGPGGWNLRWLVMQTRVVQERLNEERLALGVEPKAIVKRDDIIQYALDFATPGPLSVRSRATLDEIRGVVAGSFVLGNDTLGDVEGIEELSDEAEAVLLQQSDDADLEPTGIDAGKQRADI
ncbi:ribosomal l28 family protein [Hirsutella rhossiliensis]|uniref:Ribosomal l28 family domain-containing protein n=1 Tax=Hirsutella rhossiliensis TaxID=111463 RepID=A0A9P8MUJ6_9HYPO|nr:ribosomal l28 family domain-containing protein [Hirsutella rhossiliensis]KAH0960704.1 ribosomal l28 family domain-containing protein [Hirsutella rhossiliensis]